METEINNLVIGVNHAYSKDISSGTRTFLLSLKKDDGVSAYCRNRLEAELLGALNGTKFEVVFQPFLQEKTMKYIESTDTTFSPSENLNKLTAEEVYLQIKEKIELIN